MLAADKLAYQHVSILELAEALGNVSEACRQRGMTRTQFYEYKKRFQGKGIGGRLLEHLLQFSRDEGIKWVIAYILPENKGMIKSARSWASAWSGRMIC